MSRNNYVRRPWVSYWDTIPYDNKNLEQQCKLIRNLVASMDLGNPHFKLYDSHFAHDERRRPRTPISGRERYLEWVAAWKETYKALSQAIRDLKSQRKLKHFCEVRDRIPSLAGSNSTMEDQRRVNLHGRVEPTLDALRISAQIMLNARFVGKLASSQLRQRAYEQSQLKEAA